MENRGVRDVLSDSNDKAKDSSRKAFFSSEAVGNSGKTAIEIRFQTLIANKKELPYDWYKNLSIDKSDASKIKRGIIIPSKEWRIRIANYFDVDSTTIWDIDFKKWCELHDAVEDFWGKVSEVKK